MSPCVTVVELENAHWQQLSAKSEHDLPVELFLERRSQAENHFLLSCLYASWLRRKDITTVGRKKSLRYDCKHWQAQLCKLES